MNFRSLEYFAAVADAGSVREAAAKLYISEQSLSESIRKLEKELGGFLFVRTRPYTMTKAGEAFLGYTRKILSLKEEGLAKVREINEDEQKAGVIITTGSMGIPPFLPELLGIFRDKYPNYSTKVIQKPAGKADKFSKEELCFLPVSENPDLESIVLIEDSVVVAVAKSLMEKTYGTNYKKQAEKMKKTGDIHLLKELVFIDWHEDKENCFANVLDCLDDMDFHPKIASFSPNAAANISFCVQGLGAYITLENMLMHMRRKHGQDNFCRYIRRRSYELASWYHRKQQELRQLS